jgi:hypothetical protein
MVATLQEHSRFFDQKKAMIPSLFTAGSPDRINPVAGPCYAYAGDEAI